MVMVLFRLLLFRGQGCNLQQFLSGQCLQSAQQGVGSALLTPLRRAAKLGSGAALRVHESR